MLKKRYFTIVVALLFLTLATTQVQATPNPQNERKTAPTYTIFATREGLVGKQTANGHIIQERDNFVALPSWRALSPYKSNKFQVRLTYKGRTTIVPVWDVGPWNTNDDYWSTDRESYRDLPLGTPMAQAAYLEGYNDGLDEFGRKIQAPNGIDIADGTFWDSLGMRKNDWVQVNFLWLGDDPGPGTAIEAAPPSPRVPEKTPEPSQDGNGDELSRPPSRQSPTPKPVRTPTPTAEPTPETIPSLDTGAIVVDNSDEGYSASQSDWQTSRCGLKGSHNWTTSKKEKAQGGNRASWQTKLTTSGTYEVRAYIPRCGQIGPTKEAHYTITHDAGTTNVTVDQEAMLGTWASLGVYRFGDRLNPMVELSDIAGDDGRSVRFDALAWLPRKDSTPPEARIQKIKRQNSGYMVTWGGKDDMSGITTYDLQVRQLPRGSWRNWMLTTSLTEAWFGPDEGKQFAFRARARDWAGNEQPWRGEDADMDTTQVDQQE